MQVDFIASGYLEPKTSWYFLQTLNNMLWPLRNRILWLTQYLSIFWTRDVDYQLLILWPVPRGLLLCLQFEALASTAALGYPEQTIATGWD